MLFKSAMRTDYRMSKPYVYLMVVQVEVTTCCCRVTAIRVLLTIALAYCQSVFATNTSPGQGSSACERRKHEQMHETGFKIYCVGDLFISVLEFTECVSVAIDSVSWFVIIVI